MNKLIIFNEPVQSVRKSQQTQLFSSRKLTDSNDPFRSRVFFSELNSQENNREILWARATDAVKSTLLMSNFRINYCNWK